MASRIYALGMILSFITIGLGMTAYIKTKKIQSLGLKAALYGSLILATLLWPIGLPTAIAIMFKGLLGKITEKIFKDTEKKIEKVTKQ